MGIENARAGHALKVSFKAANADYLILGFNKKIIFKCIIIKICFKDIGYTHQ